MKVLIAHDRIDVLEQIQQVVLNQGVSADCIKTAEDGQSTRRELRAELFDLAIVDLTLPAVKGKSQAGYSTAEDIFLELYRGHELQLPGDIIGITREADALSRINVSIGPHLMAVVEETTGDEWKSKLADKLSYTMRSSVSRLVASGQQYDYDVAIITALDKELAPFRDIFSLKDAAHFPGCFEFSFTDRFDLPRRAVAYSVGQAGQAACASASQAMIARFRPRVFFLSGFCGGYQESTSPGEVMLFRSVYDWDSGKWDTPGLNKDDPGEAIFLPRPEPLGIGQGPMDLVVRGFSAQPVENVLAIENTLSELSSGAIKKLSISPVLAASGSAVVANSSILSRVRKQHDKIVAVDMEAYGFYRSCSSSPFIRPEMLTVKAVADFCDGEKDDRLHSACCYASAKVIEDVLLNRWDFPRSGVA
jgi:nucleoside phosphorylase